MKEFKIDYSYEVYDDKKKAITYWERDSFTMELESGTPDGDELRHRITNMAKEHVKKKSERVYYANYFGITKL